MKIFISFCLLILLFSTNSIAQTASDSLDSRLEKYLTSQIDDRETLNRVKNQYAEEGLAFEKFIKLMFTRELKFDTTPDNSLALSKLGAYLEKEKPKLSEELVEKLESFVEKKDNQTMMRGMVLQTIKSITNSPKK